MSHWLKKLLTSFFVSVALLAIASLDMFQHEMDHEQKFAREKIRVAKDQLRQRLEAAAPKRSQQSQGMENMLRDSLAQDEFGDQSPFAALSTLDPINKILIKGVVHFERTVFRSPDYQGESGYDLVQYEIQHKDKTQSIILAYLDRPELNLSRNVGAPDPRKPVVMVLVAEGDQSLYSLYRSGHLSEQTEIPSAAASGLVADRISLSIPFLSVSR